MLDVRLLASRVGIQQVRGDRLGFGVLGGQQRRGRGVQTGATASADRPVDSPAQQGMHEARRGALVEDPVAHQRLGRLRRAVEVEAGQRGRLAQLSAVAEDRERVGDGARLGLLPAQTRQHVAFDPRRVQRVEGGGARGIRRGSPTSQLPEQLGDRERVAGRDASRGLGERRIRGRAEGVLDQHRERLRRQRPQLERDHRGHGGEPRQQLGPGLRRPRGEHDQDRQILDPPAQVGQPLERRGIRPVEVVDGQQHGAMRREAREHPVEPVQHRQRTLRRALRLEAEDAGGEAGGAVEERRPLGGRQPHDLPLQQLPHDAEGEVALELAAAGAKHAQAVLVRKPAGGREQRRLALAGAPTNRHDRPLPAGRRPRELGQSLEGILALQQWAWIGGDRGGDVQNLGFDPVAKRSLPKQAYGSDFPRARVAAVRQNAIPDKQLEGVDDACEAPPAFNRPLPCAGFRCAALRTSLGWPNLSPGSSLPVVDGCCGRCLRSWRLPSRRSVALWHRHRGMDDPRLEPLLTTRHIYRPLPVSRSRGGWARTSPHIGLPDPPAASSLVMAAKG